MTIKLTFLSASTPLTKRIVKNKDGSLTKHGYPHVANFTSTTTPVKTLKDMYVAIMEAMSDPAKPCLLKGTIQHALENESRAKSTSSNSITRWLCLDLDRAPFSSSEEFMAAIQMHDISYIVQYSSSYKLDPKDKTLSAHIFVTLDQTMQPGQIKAWLMYLNFNTPVLRSSITLTNSAGSGLHYPLDITTCQNDKLLYIAEPAFVNMTSPVKAEARVKMVKKEFDNLPTARMAMQPLDALNKDKRELWNKLRIDAGLPTCNVKVKQQGEYTVQTGIGEVSAYEVIDDGGEYIRYNLAHLNGSMGDSGAYWHARTNFELLHSFKGEDSMVMKEVMPGRYAELTRELQGDLASVSEDGDAMIAFRNSEDSDYYSALWNASEHTLWLRKVKNKDALNEWVMSHGRSPGPFVPTWEIHFDPQDDVVVDLENKKINTFILPKLIREHEKAKGKWDHIKLLIDHAFGYNEACVEHFMNHLAVIFQLRHKPGTAWVLHGTEGTGKGMLVNVVLRGILGSYVAIKPAGQLEDKFNEWLAQALIAFVDEIEADALMQKSTEGDLRNMITEPTLSIRRMQTAAREIPNYTMLIFSSNRPQPVRIPKGDRRYNVADFQGVTLATMLETEMKMTPSQFIVKLKAELAAFTHYIMERKADVTLASKVVQTEARSLIQELSVTSVDETAIAITTGDFEKLHSFMPDEKLMQETNNQNMAARGYAMLLRKWSEEAVSRVTRDELFIIFEHCVGGIPESANKFTSYLRHHSIHTKRLRVDDGSLAYGIEVKWRMSVKERKTLFPEGEKFSQRQTLKRVK